MNRLCILSLPLLLSIVLGAHAQDLEMRKWRDDSGKFEIDAVFVRLEKDDVLLEKADGSELRVPLQRLSKDDRNWISMNVGGKTGGATDPLQVQLLPNSVWELEPDPLIAPAFSPRPVYLPFDVPIDFGIMNLVIRGQVVSSRDGSWVLANMNSKGVLANARTEEEQTQIKVDSMGVHAALSNSGRLLLRLNPPSPIVEVVDVSSGSCNVIEKLNSGQRTGKTNSGDTNLLFTDLAGDDYAVTASQDGVVVAWSTQDGKPIWWLSAPGCIPAITPGGKYLLACVEKLLIAVDVASGKVVAQVEVPRNGLSQLFISPSGQFIAERGSGMVRIWEFANGSLRREFADYSSNDNAAYAWIDDRYLAYSGFWRGGILDTELGLVIWTFHGNESKRLAVIPNYGLWLFTTVPQLIVEPFPIPGDGLSEISAVLGRSIQTIMGPNAPVRLQWSLDDVPENISNSIRKRVQDCLTEKGIRISENGVGELRIHANSSVSVNGDNVITTLRLSVGVWESEGEQIWYHSYPAVTLGANATDLAAYDWLNLPREITRLQEDGGMEGFRTGYNKRRTPRLK